jgi:ABC-type branched-subunit amino acid transport system ATPase component
MKALFIHGPNASGKTYMANAIAQLCKSESNGEEIIVKDGRETFAIHPLDLMNAGVIIIEEIETLDALLTLHAHALKYISKMKIEDVRFIFTSQKDFVLPEGLFIKIKASYRA